MAEVLTKLIAAVSRSHSELGKTGEAESTNTIANIVDRHLGSELKPRLLGGAPNSHLVYITWCWERATCSCTLWSPSLEWPKHLLDELCRSPY